VEDEGVMEGNASPFVLPTGTVTFLLTDVEGSSRLWEQAPAAMARAIPRHYELIDVAISAHGGVRPVEQGEGDSVVGAFSCASDAAAAAIDVQRAFAAEPWPDGIQVRVRIAIHTGEARLLNEGSYVGDVLNRAARIRAVGHGGQVLISAASTELLAGRIGGDSFLVDLGVHRLKDLGRAEHLWQLTDPERPAQFPPLRSLGAFRHNLPVQLSPLIGRTADIAAVRTLLTTDRLVTLTGAAGVGKTRLAVAVSAEATEMPGGVWWVELAPLSDPDAIGRAAIAAVGAVDDVGPSHAIQLSIRLGGDPSLVVLDNCEHLVAACASFVSELLLANPAVAVLATSREPLGVPGEIVWRVPSLPCSPRDRDLTPEALSHYDAVALFVDRARRARPTFAISEVNAPAVANICHRLDGIPLAIELAAARCRQMSAERIATELDDRFRLLTGGSRTLMARQQTLTASVDWSHDRLDVAERSTFRRLGVFSGRFPLEAAEAIIPVCGGVETEAVFELVSLLVDKSLVVVEESPDGQPRYRLLETLRAYAVDRARAEGELELLREAHASWWAGWFETRTANPNGSSFEQIEAYYDNLSAAVDWGGYEPQLGLRLLYGMAKVAQDIGRAGDAVAAAQRLLTDESAEAYGELWLRAAGATSFRYDTRSFDELQAFAARMEEVATRLDDEYHVALARFHRSEDAHDALVLRELATARGESYVAATAAVMYAQTVAYDDPLAAIGPLDEAEQVAASVGSRIPREYACRTRGRIARDIGNLDQSMELARALTTSRSQLIVENGVSLLGEVGLLVRDDDALRDAIDVAERFHRGGVADGEALDRARHRLATLEGVAASRVDPALGGVRPMSPGTRWLICREALDAGRPDVALRGVEALSLTTPNTRAVRVAIEAAATTDEHRWHEALHAAADHGLRLIAVDALEALAVAAGEDDSHVDCLRIAAAATRLRDETGYRWRFNREQVRFDDARTAALETLGARAGAAIAEGHELDVRDAVAYVDRARPAQ
jgi:predicted ATPase/class 3 adenylate cyclase